MAMSTKRFDHRTAVHIIVDFQQQADRFDKRTMMWRVPMLD
jgi:hypothetical protein